MSHERIRATAGDDVVSNISYSINTSNNLLSLPNDLSVLHGTTHLRKRTATYDMSTGELTSMTVNNGSQTSIYSFLYDSYGNMSKFTMPENYNQQAMYYEYGYDNIIHSLPTSVTDAFGYHSSTDYDYRIQAPISTTDMTGNRMEYTYYSDGALKTVTGPNELANGDPYSIRFDYYNQSASTNNQPWAKTTYFDPLNSGNEFFNTIFTDGTGRIIQTKTKAVVFDQATGSDQEVLTVSGRNIIDAYGRVIYSYYPDIENNTNDTISLSIYGNQTINTKISYDAMDRKTDIRMPDNTHNYMTYGFGNDAYGVKQFMQSTEDALHTKFYSYTNAIGKQTTLRAPLGTITKFSYNPLGELIESIDPENKSTTYAYDQIGQLQSRTHPDAGTTSYTYDDAGNLRTVQTANLAAQSKTIKYYYDYNRLSKVEYPNSLGNDVYYEYGGLDPQTHDPNNQTGRLVKMQDASGVQEFNYGNMGELIKNIHTFVVPGGHPYTFEMKWVYDSWNRIDSIYYPDGEQVKYGYNNAGKLTSMLGRKGQVVYNYVDSIRYDKFGSRVRIRNGNGTASKYTYDPQNRRLTNLKTWDAQNNLLQNINYSYIANGNISCAANSAGSISALGGNANYYHAYDSLSRLVLSIGSFTDDNNNNYSYYQTMTYSASGNIIQKANQGTTLLSGISTSFNYTNNYQYAGGKPHAVSSIKDANNNTTHNMSWDANGNMTYLSQPSVSMSRSMCWDEENRLTVVRDPKQLSHYIYNAGGERVWKLTGGIERMSVNGKDYIDQAILSKTLYTSPYMIVTDKEYTKHYYIESQRVATKLGGGMSNNLVDPISGTLDAIAGDVNRIASDLIENLVGYSCTEKITIEIKPQFGNMEELMNQDNDETDQYFYHGDHLGSSAWITDADGNVNQYLAYMPFGEQLVDQRATGHDIRFKFTGKERDSETGFDYFGARYYASDLSVWLSVDPLSDMYPSTSPFMYVRGNPVMLVDPDGLSDGPVKGRKPRGNKRWFKHKNRNMGNGQKLVWRHKNAKKSPNERIASASGKIPKIRTGNYDTSPWQNVGTGNNGRTTFTLNRVPNQDYLRSLRVLGPGPGGFVATAITTTNGGFIDGYFDQFYITSPDGTMVPGSNGMYGGFIPGLSLAANYVAKYFPTKPLSKVISVIVLALNSQRINPIYRNTHHVNVNRGAWGTNGQYNLQARFRQFNFIDPKDRGKLFKWWYGI